MREILIEFERVQIIRKRTQTNIEFCVKCRALVDFITLVKAVKVFDTQTDSLVQFINAKGVHFYTDTNEDSKMCLVSLLEKMNEEKGRTTKSWVPK